MKSIKDFKLGDCASISRTISESDVYNFGGLIGDQSPWHFNEEFCKKTRFQTRIVYGMYVGALFGTIIGRELPGPNGMYCSQELKFLTPVKIGDTVTAICEVVELNVDKKRLKLKTIAKNQSGETVIDGFAVIKVMEI